MTAINDKKEQFLSKMREFVQKDIVVAFSGGVDSSLVLAAACREAQKTGKKVFAVVVQTNLHPAVEIWDARHLAGQMGAEPFVIEVDELQEAGIIKNPENRCYLCKKCLFQKIQKKAAELGAETILEGTNEDDLHVYRPGIQALRELNIISPLAMAHITKKEIRQMAQEYGLETAEKPAAPCLATRFPYGTFLNEEKLKCVEKGEAYLKSCGLKNVRLRVHEDIARIEVEFSDFTSLLARKREITEYLKQLGYQYITLDLEGFRSGSMDIYILEEHTAEQNGGER